MTLTDSTMRYACSCSLFWNRLGYPVVLRPAYTMGGAGGGLVYNKEELRTVCARGLQASLVGQVLVEESILGWEELELEIDPRHP